MVMGIGIGDFHALHAKAHEHDFCHEPTEGERPHWQFKSGQSGNPAGRAKRSKNRATLLSDAMLADKTGHIVQKVIDDALAGDKASLRACFARVAPVGRGRPVRVELPEEAAPEDLDAAMQATQRAFLAGEIGAQEALAIAAWVAARRADENARLLAEERRARIAETRLRAEERRDRLNHFRWMHSEAFEEIDEAILDGEGVDSEIEDDAEPEDATAPAVADRPEEETAEALVRRDWRALSDAQRARVRSLHWSARPRVTWTEEDIDAARRAFNRRPGETVDGLHMQSPPIPADGASAPVR